MLATFRQSFRDWLGYSVNFGYTRTSVHSTFQPGQAPGVSLTNFDALNNVFEVSGSYIAQKHFTQKMTGFGELGAGALIYQPGQVRTATTPPGTTIVAPVTPRPMGIFGAGLEYHFDPQWSIRAEYRGQVYKFPDYGLGLQKSVTVTNEPTISLTYTFGRRRHHFRQ